MGAGLHPVDKPPGQRRSRKEATRQRVLAAAGELFDTYGYQGSTIREIARRAGVAVGSVFTTFSSKGEILAEVMEARLEPLYAEVDRVMSHVGGSAADRLRALFAVHFTFEFRRVRLFLSHIAAAYDWTQSLSPRPYGRNERLIAAVRRVLVEGVAAGDVRADSDIDEIVELLLAAYAWTYRLVITSDADEKAMIAVMDRRIGLIAGGFTARD